MNRQCVPETYCRETCPKEREKVETTTVAERLVVETSEYKVVSKPWGSCLSLKTQNGPPLWERFSVGNGPFGKSGVSKFRRGTGAGLNFLGLSLLFRGKKTSMVNIRKTR